MNERFMREQFGLEGKRAVVTGGGRGIGRSIAEALAATGAEVLIHYHSSREAAEQVVAHITEAGGSAWSVGADLTDSAQVKAMFEKVAEHWDSLDILVNNAGDLVQRSMVADITDELVQKVVAVNLCTTVYVNREAIGLLRRGRDACMIHLGSIAAPTGGGPGSSLYAAMKGALHTYSRNLAKELAPDIRVNTIAPGVILTDFQRRHSSDELLEQFKSATPLKRHGLPEEHGAAAVFLCAPASSFITGTVLHINGGLWMG